MSSLSKASVSSRNVLIHVFDEYRKIAKDFVCRRDVLLAKMKYFQAYLNASNEHDEIDISVHCDVEVFEWLVQYMQQSESEWKPRLALDNVASILVSSEFLQMDALVDECVRFVAARMQAFLQLRVDFSCLSDATLGKIAACCSAEELQALHDPKDKILSKLYRKKLDAYVKSVQGIARCSSCSAIYLLASDAALSCPSGKRQVGTHGELVARHEPSADWRVDDFVRDATGDKRVSWSAVYWFVWASTTNFFCSACRRHFAFVGLHTCAFHPGAVTGVGLDAAFSCCGGRAFDSSDLAGTGCCAREHSPLFSEHVDATIEQRFDTITKVSGLWDLICSCERAVTPVTAAAAVVPAAKCAASSSSSSSSSEAAASLRREMLLQLLHIEPQDAPSAAFKRPATAATSVSVSASVSGSAAVDPNSPPRRRQQWRALLLQEKDRVRHQLLARRLIQMRKNIVT